MTFIRPLNKGQGHSFWYQSISYIPLLVANSNFCSRTRTPFSHNTSRYRQTDDDDDDERRRRSQH